MSVSNIKHFILLETFVLVFANTENVHLSDSYINLIKGAVSNFTTYKLRVPGSDPITIFEDSNQPSISDNTDSDRVNRHAEHTRRNGEHYTEKELVPLASSLQQRLNNRNQDVRTTLSFQISDLDKPIEGSDMDRDQKKVVYSPPLLKKFVKEYSEKIKNADQNTKNALKEIERINQKYVNEEEEATTDRMDLENDDKIEEKYNTWNDRYSHKHQHQTNPYNDKDGWVTLEAVPWSSSKVSKWHPHSNKFSSFDNKNSYNRPSSHQPSYNDDNDNHQTFPKPRPPNYYNDELDDDYIEDQPTGKPIYTSYDPYRPSQGRPQHSSKPSWSLNQNSGYDKRPSHKPRPRPQYDYNHSSSNNQYHQLPDEDDRPDSSEHWYNNDYNTPKPWSQDIITDNRPSDFPVRSPSKRPHSHSSDNDYSKYRPFSHPDNGNGEWVLVSTTKGFQAPTRHGQRAVAFSNNKPNELTSHHSVKLTVLPAKNNTFSYDRRPMALSHGGMLEVESSFESVEDSANAAAASSLNGAKNPKVKKRNVFRSVPMKKGISTDDGSAVMAAAAAGMVPATMAMLIPMVLGRRRRSVDNSIKHRQALVFKEFK